jgi:F-type H+-transporting ATPase subunit epsilon
MLNITIISPEKKLYEGQATSVIVPSVDGSFEVLTNHAPIVAALVQGTIIITDTLAKKTKMDIAGGFVEVLNNSISVLAQQ